MRGEPIISWPLSSDLQRSHAQHQHPDSPVVDAHGFLAQVGRIEDEEIGQDMAIRPIGRLM